MNNQKKFSNKKSENEYIVGRNAVKEALKSGRIIDCIMISENARAVSEIINLAKSKNITVKKVNKSVLDSFGNFNHQGRNLGSC